MNKKCPDYSSTQRISLPLFFMRMAHHLIHFCILVPIKWKTLNDCLLNELIVLKSIFRNHQIGTMPICLRATFVVDFFFYWTNTY